MGALGDSLGGAALAEGPEVRQDLFLPHVFMGIGAEGGTHACQNVVDQALHTRGTDIGFTILLEHPQVDALQVEKEPVQDAPHPPKAFGSAPGPSGRTTS